MIPGLVLLAGVGSLLWVCAEGSMALLYVLVYLIALLPGVPLGLSVFGHRHAAGWISGALLGYALTAVTLSVAIYLGARTVWGFALSWILLLSLCVLVRRVAGAPKERANVSAALRRGGGAPAPLNLVKLPAWSRRDTMALLCVLCVVPVLMWLPYAHNGAPDAGGTRFYRAYFTADFLWHMALTGELTRFSLPPANPYLGDQTLHYYWMYFTVPAVGASLLRSGGHIVEQCLEINAVLSGLLFVSAVFMATWAAVPRAAAAATAVSLAFVAASVQGWYGIYYYLYARGRPMAYLSELNIGALTSWILQGLRIDGLPRSLWWTPQHAAACALGLIAVTAVYGGPATLSVVGILIVGVALGAALMFSPLLGGAFALIYGVSVAISALRQRVGFMRVVSRHALAALPVALALAWCMASQMVEGAGSALAFGFGGLAKYAPLQTVLLAFGPLLVPALVGAALPRFPMTAVPHAVGALIGLVLLYFVRLAPDPAWVGFRAGQILQITLSGLAAISIARILDARRPVRVSGLVVLALLFLAGLPTTVIDVYNAQDIGNRLMGPGFRWTIDITPDEQAAFDWVKRATPPEASVQMEPTSRGRETWTLVPSFGERRMAAGLPISLIDHPEYHRRSDLVRSLYETSTGEEAWDVARRLGIDYIYVDRTERAAFGPAVEKFDADPHFLAVYRNDEVRVYAVQP